MINRIFSTIQRQIQKVKEKYKNPNTPEIQETDSKLIETRANSQLIFGNNYVLNLSNPKIAQRLATGNIATIGSHKCCTLQVPKFHDGIKEKHATIRKKDDKTIIIEADKNADVKVIEKKDAKPFYFGTRDIEFSQENTGDCYLLATLYALSRTDFGERFLRNMVAINENSDYIVKFQNQEPIMVPKAELYENDSLQSVSGELGLKAIERAYGKLINPLYKKSRNWGTLRNPLYESEYYKSISCFNRRCLDKGGFMTNALKKITGLGTNEYTLKSLNIRPFLTEIKNYGLKDQIITCSTPCEGTYGKHVDKGKKFITGHAYAIKDIDTEKETVEIVNPHNTKTSEIISWKDFKKMFEYICIARLKKDT